MEHSQLGRRSLAHLLLLNHPMHPLKQAVMDAIDSLRAELIGLSHAIHSTPGEEADGGTASNVILGRQPVNLACVRRHSLN
ncbi:MAG: hypothetical protein DDT20_01872 [Firmicutes bacterium]|nr:hypothetical protein [Bacillota bacterium]